ncbi:MAG: hypothetical protein JNL82_20780 [Myxococcales bacterium]|nr:hypothetical protein [Myxococcales bacterium]
MKSHASHLLLALGLLPACPGDGGGDTDAGTTPATTTMTTAGPSAPTTGDATTAATDPDTTGAPDTSTTTDTTGAPPADAQLCVDLGGATGVAALVDLFLGELLRDARINAYFLRSDLDVAGLRQCVIDQLGAEAGCDGVTYTCKTMEAAHAGLGISTQDFTDFAEDFGKAWDAHKAASAPDLTDQQRIDVTMTLASLAPVIVEDTANNVTVYQRVGRKPAIEALVGDPAAPGTFLANVSADPTLAGFFVANPTDFARLKTCLVRQIHSFDGPDTYGRERSDNPPGVDPGPTAEDPCRDMITAHLGMVDDMGGAIEFVDYTTLVTALVNAMTTAGVAMPDQNAIRGHIDPLCPQIVAVDPEACPMP